MTRHDEPLTAPPWVGISVAPALAEATDRLATVGLNLLAVLDVEGLPPDVHTAVLAAHAQPAAPAAQPARWRPRQLILVGHGGPRLWSAVQAAGVSGPDPIDTFSVAQVRDWLAQVAPGAHYQVLYPGDAPVGLQALGVLAGWHHPSPFRVGVNQRWGSWYAYRVLVVAETCLPLTPAWPEPSPCIGCAAPCVAACPAGALQLPMMVHDAGRDGAFSLPACIRHRCQPASACQYTCVAREACPLVPGARYEPAQLRHAYGRSLRMLSAYLDSLPSTEESS